MSQTEKIQVLELELGQQIETKNQIEANVKLMEVELKEEKQKLENQLDIKSMLETSFANAKAKFKEELKEKEIEISELISKHEEQEA